MASGGLEICVSSTSFQKLNLNSALFLRFEKKCFWIESWNIILSFSTFSVGGCWGQPMSFFWKLFDETQISAPPEATRNHTSIKLMIPLPLRADLLMSVHSETPCIRPTNIGILIKIIEWKWTSKDCESLYVLLINIIVLVHDIYHIFFCPCCCSLVVVAKYTWIVSARESILLLQM